MTSANDGSLRLLAFGIAVSVVAWGGAAFDSLYSVDDYAVASDVELGRKMLADGRFGTALVHAALGRLGVDFDSYHVAGAALLAGGVAFAALVALRLWRVEGLGIGYAIVALVVTHPYLAEFYYFRFARLMYALAFFLVFAALALAERRRLRIAACASCFALGLGFFQAVVNHAAVVLLISAALAVVRSAQPSPAGAWARLREELRQHEAPRLLVAIAGTSLYLALNQAAAVASGVDAFSRAGLVGPGELLPRAVAVARTLASLHVAGDALVPAPLAGLVAAISMASAGAAALAVVRREGRWFGLLGLLAAALLLAVAATVGLVALLAVYWPSPRLVSQVGLFAAGMLALGAAARPRLTTPLAAAAALAALGFVFVDNRIVADQIRLNRIEQLLANRVIARLEQSEGFADVRSVVIASRRLRLLDRVRSTHDLNVSPFFHRWSRHAVLNLVGGFDFEPPSDERLAAVEAECERLPKWPHRDSIRIDGREAVVCLP